MANVRWLGRAHKVKQVTTITIGGTIAIGETFTITINGKDLSFVTTATTTANVVDGLHALVSASDAPAEFQEGVWTKADPVITMTGQDAFAGVPITISVSTNSVSGTITPATPTAATGPEHVDDTNNWSGGALPTNSDNLFFDHAEYGPKYALNALSSVTGLTIEISANAVYDIGLPRVNDSGGYTEYRQTHFQFSGGSVFIRDGAGIGSSLIRLDGGSATTTLEVEQSGSSREVGMPAVHFIGTNASNVLEVQEGDVGVAVRNEQVATLSQLQNAGGQVVCGNGVTLTTVQCFGGSVEVNSAVSGAVTVNDGGEFTMNGSGALATLVINPGGVVNYNSTGTITNCTVFGLLDLTGDVDTKTITTLQMEAGGQVDGFDRASFTSFVKGGEVRQLIAA